MSRKTDPADQAVVYFATEQADLARATLNRCIAVMKARENAREPRSVKKRAIAAQVEKAVGQ